MLKSIRNFILDNNTEIKICNNKVYISNYKEISDFESDRIHIKGDFNIKILGSNLVISKLLNNELLITGNINNIVLGDK